MDHGILSFTDPLSIARHKHFRAYLASSFDRRGGNHDWSNYIRREGRAAVLMETDGPGCITRFWVADPQKGILRIELDGEEVVRKPLHEFLPSLQLSQGIGGESPENYARSRAESVPMGFTSYCPIAFQRHCKVLIEPEDDYLYYQINYQVDPPGTHRETWRGSESSAAARAEDVLEEWKRGGPWVEMTRAIGSILEIGPGQGVDWASSQTHGVIRGLRVHLQTSGTALEEAHVRDSLWVIGHFDDDEPRDPSIRAPIGPLFLDFGQTHRPRSVFVGEDGEGYYLFFPMPYRNSMSLRFENRGILPVKLSAAILTEPCEPDGDLLRFRASWHVETPFGPDHRDYEGLACRLLNLDGFNNVEMLNVVQGAGHFVGCGFQVDLRDAPTDRAAGEGDEMFFIDGDPRLTMNGTGLEDYVNDAWGIRGYVGPLSGDSVSGEWGRNPQIFGYRLHVPDPIPFVHSGRFTLEHGTGNNCSGLYRSIAYWYMDPSMTRTRAEEWRWEAIRTGKAMANEEETA